MTADPSVFMPERRIFSTASTSVEAVSVVSSVHVSNYIVSFKERFPYNVHVPFDREELAEFCK